MEDSVFTKIIRGELPCHKVYENDKVIAFLTIGPVAEGHTLVVPKLQVDQYIDLPADDYAELWLAVKKVAARLRDVIGKDRVGVVIKGIEVPHTHVHLVPFNEDEPVNLDSSSKQVNPENLGQIAEKLYFND